MDERDREAMNSEPFNADSGMKKLSSADKTQREKAVNDAGGILIATMVAYEIPNRIEAKFEHGRYSYELKFTKKIIGNEQTRKAKANRRSDKETDHLS